MLIEILRFLLRRGVDEATFLAADARFQTEVVPFDAGFVRRTTARGDGGEWVVITIWGSPEEADASAAQARDHEAAQALDALIDEATVDRRRYITID